MDTVYGTKKYFQSLSGASDIYRTQACRSMVNDYSYQNTLGRSTLGAYYHMNKQNPYTNEQYGYNTWGMWRGDARNVAPSTFSTKTHTHYQKTRSFSIILTTAAFIVLLAVISIAGLAFYFSSIKATMEDPVLGFEGSFRIAKGDTYVTGLKFNHTTTYKQKVEFYKRFVVRSLMDNNLHPLRVDVWGFGDGPLIKVSFRTFFDVRKLPQNIHNVEEFIRESLFAETTSFKSLYKSLRIDAVEIKRIFDEQLVKSASLFKEAQSVPTSQTQLEKRLMKKGSTGGVLKTIGAATTARPYYYDSVSHSPDDEPDVDVENAPVIQGSFEGSFEITKTDADIARKKTTPTRAYSSSPPPKSVTPYSLRVKPKKPAIEKITTIIPQKFTTTTTTTRKTTTTPIPTTKRKSTSTTTTTTSTTTTTPAPTTTQPRTTTTTTTTTSTTPKPTTSSTTPATTTTTTTTTSTTPRPTTISTLRPQTIQNAFANQFTFPSISTPSPGLSVPKLDTNLFTSFPILDTQPWRPIHREVPELMPGPPPAFPTKTIPLNGAKVALLPKDIPQKRIDEVELPFIPENPQPPPVVFNPYAPGFFGATIRKPDSKEESVHPQDMMFYHSFGNPVFMPGTDDIERLGIGASVQPHPLPVPLLDDVVIPPFKPLEPTLDVLNTSDSLLPFTADNKKFEHLGGGVIAKKQEEPVTEVETSSSTESSSIKLEVTEESSTLSSSTEQSSLEFSSTPKIELVDSLGEFFMDLLNLTKEENNTTTPQSIESRIGSEELASSMESIAPVTTTAKPTESEGATKSKPNFMNLKEIILRRNEAAKNKTASDRATTKAPTTTTSIMPTTKWERIRPSNAKPPTILDDSSLFPSHSKWEFFNGSQAGSNGPHTGNMRKVFNKTLQAWVSEDVEKSENFTLSDIKTRINNATNIQDISLIFDTLASKLGITPSMPTKVPPFSSNKLKQSQRNESAAKVPTTLHTTKAPATTTTHFFPSTTFASIKREPFIRPMSSFMSEDSSSEGIGAAIPVVGEAEVEVIDPNKYEEMLKSSQFAESTTTETAPKLVTLLPVRSNSGIRTYRPIEETKRSNSEEVAKASPIASSIITGKNKATAGIGNRPALTRKTFASQSRRFPPAEAVIRGGLKVSVK